MPTENVHHFASWEDCYTQHLEASLALDGIIAKLKENPEYLPKEIVLDLCDKVILDSFSLLFSLLLTMCTPSR